MHRMLLQVCVIILAAVFVACAPLTRAEYPAPRTKSNVDFPEIKDWNSLTIEGIRSSGALCFGRCPFYDFAIHGDGTVEFHGRFGVLAKGQHRARISQATIRDLFEHFRTTEYFRFNGRQILKIEVPEDAGEQLTSISFDGHEVGVEIGWLADAVDEAAGVERWVAGNDETLPSLRAEGWNFRSADPDNLEMIVAAAEYAKPAIVRGLLREGLPVSGLGAAIGCRALQAAISGPLIRFENENPYVDSLRRESIVRMLLTAGAPIHADTADCEPFLAAARSGSPVVMKMLLEHRPDLNRRDKYGDTALMVAAGVPEEGEADLTILSMLLAAGPWDKQHIGEAMITAASIGNFHATRYFLSAGGDPNFAGKGGETALMVAAGAESELIARLLLDRGVNVNATDLARTTALMRAAGAVAHKTMMLLVDRGAHVNAADSAGFTALIRSAMATSTSGREKREIAIRTLIDSGADLHACAADMKPVLAQSFDDDVARILLSAGADPNRRCPGGLYPLEAARLRVISVLLDAGADPWTKRDDGRTIYEELCAMRSNRCSEMQNWLTKHPEVTSPRPSPS